MSWNDLGTGSSFPPVIDTVAESTPRELEAVAHHIAACCATREEAFDVAAILGVGRQAFEDALRALRGIRYAAPATRIFTKLHILDITGNATLCGIVLQPDNLWQDLERADGDKVCAACAAAKPRDTAPALW